MALVTVLSSAVVFESRPAVGDSVASEQAQAASIEATIQQTGLKISALNEQYNQAQVNLEQIQGQVAATKAAIVKDEAQVASDTANLRGEAVDAYISAGTQATSNPLFASNQKTYAAQTEYGNVASDTLSTAVANLTNSQDQLATQQAQLQTQEASAQAATNSAAGALSEAQGLQAQQSAALNQVKGQIAVLIQQQEAAKQAAALAAAKATLAAASSGGSSGSGGGSGAGRNIPVPPSNLAAGERAVQYAESQIGVPYVWGGTTPGVGFDCSGLVQWAWAQAGVSLPRTSGSQFAATTPVPISALEPGDLLFYGPSGSTHVAMYIGGGQVIQAPYTGATVGISAMMINGFGEVFAGAGRP